MEEKYFAAANSGEGFVSYFGEVFREQDFEHIYIIKGGPGTGKSYFMRQVAKAAERQGEKVVYWYCSSDPDSLDGITVGKRFAMVDGTSPHDVSCKTPGAVENIVDLGVFWSVPSLSKMRREIEALNSEKSGAYGLSYRFLSAYSQLSDAAQDTVAPFVNVKKLEDEAHRLLADLSDGDGYEISTALCDSVGMKGRVRFDTYERFAQRTVKITDFFETAHILLSAVACEARRRNMKIRVSYNPIQPKRIDALCVEGKLALCISDEVSAINMKDFVKSEFNESEAARILDLRSVIFSEAVSALDRVRQVHFKIEEIYQSAMNFAQKEDFTQKFIERVIKIPERVEKNGKIV